MPREFAKPDAKNVTPAEPKAEKAPELKSVTSNDVGDQTETKASKAAKEKE